MKKEQNNKETPSNEKVSILVTKKNILISKSRMFLG